MSSPRRSTLFCIILALTATGWSSAPPLYEILDLVPPGVDPATAISAVSINNAGQVALNAGGHVWLWDSTTGIYTDLGAGTATRINNAGQVMGTLLPKQATIWEAGQPPLTYSSPGVFVGFNDVGELAGWIVHYRRIGFYMNHDVQTYIPSFTGDSFGQTAGDAINNRGQITGMAQTANNQYNAIIFENGKSRSKGRFGAHDYAEGMAINDKGQFAAMAQSWTTGQDDGYLHDGTRVIKIAPLAAGDGVDPNGINENADVIGYSNGIPFVRMDGLTYAVDSFVPAGSDWTTVTIAQINDNRWMVGWGYHAGQSHAYLLRPAGSAGSVPSVAPGPPLTLEAGASARNAILATITDPDTPLTDLVINLPTLYPGLSATNVGFTAGTLTADIASACTTVPGHDVIIVRAADPTLVGTAGFFVDVTPNRAPLIGGYASTTLQLADAASIAPSAPPADSGGIKSVVATAPGFGGTLSTDSVTGTITIADATPSGTYTVSVTVTDNCDASWTTMFALHVLPVATTTTLAASPNPSVKDQPVAFSAVVTSDGHGTPTGSVTFYDGTKSIGKAALASGAATLSKSNLGVGSHAITAQFVGDSDYLTSTSLPVTQIVAKKTTSTQLSVSTSSVTVGEPLTMTATVSIVAPGTGVPEGTVKFYDGPALLGSAKLTGGVASLAKTFAAGTHALQARYVGNSASAASVSAIVPLVVMP